MMSVLEEIESEFPVAEWRVDGRRAWPFVRTRLGYGFANESSGIAIPPAQVGARAIAVEALGVLAALPRIVKAARPHTTTRALATIDSVFFSDGASFLRTADGTFVERHCDPLRRSLRDRGHESYLLVPGHSMPGPLTPPTAYVQPRLDLARALARISRRPRTELPEFDGVREVLGRRNLDRHLPPESVISYAMSAIDRCAATFGRLFAGLHIGAGLVVGYYSLQSMAFVLACRLAGIPSVDLQHGVQGRLHFAYGRWRRVPADGYELLPRFFWVWSAEEAAAINEWRGSIADHEPIVGGNPLLQQWAAGQIGSGDFATGDAGVAERAGAARRTVLWTLHGWESGLDLERIARSVASGPANWFWWLRAHPLHLDRVEELVHELDRHGVRNADVREASRVPLFALLQQVDVHVTEYSSVVLEAERFGVASVVVHPVGEELYADRVATGVVTVARPNGDNLFEVVERQAVQRTRTAVAPPSEPPGLDWLLGLLGEQSSGTRPGSW
jgi:hypothetical protein